MKNKCFLSLSTTERLQNWLLEQNQNQTAIFVPLFAIYHRHYRFASYGLRETAIHRLVLALPVELARGHRNL